MAIDIAKGKSMFYIQSIPGVSFLEPIEYDHSLSNFRRIDRFIKEESISKNDLAIVMESTSTYHYPVMRYFLEQTYEVIVVNPNLIKKSSTTFRKTKTDKLDCVKIVEAYYKEDIKSNAIKNGTLYDDLQAANRQYLSIEKALTAMKNRYVRLLDICIPEHEKYYTDKNNKYSLKYITLFEYLPHSEYIQTTRVDRIANILNMTFHRKHTRRLTSEAIKLKAISKDSYPGVSKYSNEVVNLGQTIYLLKILLEQQELAKAKLLHLGKQPREYIFIHSIPGIGELSASQIIAELGDISRFKNYKQINAYCGLEPSVYQSGKAYYNGKITKAGNPFARKVLYTAVMGIIKSQTKYWPEHPINVYYRTKKEKEKKSTKASVIATSTKLIRIIFSLCKHESTFIK